MNIYRLKGWTWPGMSKNRYSVVANYTTNLIYDRLGPGLTEELIRKTPKNDSGYRPNKLHQWLSEDIGDPMLATHMHSILMFQRLALANRYGSNQFAHGRPSLCHVAGQGWNCRWTTLTIPTRDLAAFRAASVRCSAVIFRARAAPPLRRGR